MAPPERRRADADAEDDDVVIEHPNRKKGASKVTRAVVVLLLVASIVLVAVVTIAGWDFLQGAKVLQVAYVALYALITFYVLRWNRGVLPLTAALAIILAIFALVSAGSWFDRDAAGFAQPSIDADVLGLVCILIIPVQLLLLIASLVGFRQAWNVEVERRPDAGAPPRAAAAPA